MPERLRMILIKYKLQDKTPLDVACAVQNKINIVKEKLTQLAVKRSKH
jgi:hypothetical protein